MGLVHTAARMDESGLGCCKWFDLFSKVVLLALDWVALQSKVVGFLTTPALKGAQLFDPFEQEHCVLMGMVGKDGSLVG